MEAADKVTAKASRSNSAEIALGFLHGLLVTFSIALCGIFLSMLMHSSYPSPPIVTAVAIGVFVSAIVSPFVFEISSAARSYNQDRDGFAKGKIIAIAVYFFVAAYFFFIASRCCPGDGFN